VPIRRCRYAGAHDVAYWSAKKSTAAALAASSRCRSGPAGAAVAAVAGAPTAAVRSAPAVARAASVSTSAASCPAAPAWTGARSA